MLAKAMLLSTLTFGAVEPKVASTATMLDSTDQCPAAMQQLVEHHHMQNNVFSKGQGYLKARKVVANQGTVVLNISCKPLEDK